MTDQTQGHNPVSQAHFTELVCSANLTSLRAEYIEETKEDYISMAHMFYGTKEAVLNFAQAHRLEVNTDNPTFPHLGFSYPAEFNWVDGELESYSFEFAGIHVDLSVEVQDVQV